MYILYGHPRYFKFKKKILTVRPVFSDYLSVSYDYLENELTIRTLDKIFAEGLKNFDCVLILMNCLHNSEQQVKETLD